MDLLRSLFLGLMYPGPASYLSVLVWWWFPHNELPFTNLPSLDLSTKINASHLNADMLVGKYIPNLIAKPFDVSYAQIIYDQTSSPTLDKVLKKWEQIILVELLAYHLPAGSRPKISYLPPSEIARSILCHAKNLKKRFITSMKTRSRLLPLPVRLLMRRLSLHIQPPLLPYHCFSAVIWAHRKHWRHSD